MHGGGDFLITQSLYESAWGLVFYSFLQCPPHPTVFETQQFSYYPHNFHHQTMYLVLYVLFQIISAIQKHYTKHKRNKLLIIPTIYNIIPSQSVNAASQNLCTQFTYFFIQYQVFRIIRSTSYKWKKLQGFHTIYIILSIWDYTFFVIQYQPFRNNHSTLSV